MSDTVIRAGEAIAPAAETAASVVAPIEVVPAPSVSLRSLAAGQAGIVECLRAVDSLPKRTAFARLLGADPLIPAVRARYENLLGELEVGTILDRLGEGWTVLHSVPTVDGGTIAHLVIGRAGIFAIDTRVAPGADIVVSGDEMSSGDVTIPLPVLAVDQAAHAAVRLSELAGGPIAVEPIVVVARAATLAYGELPAPVPVLTPDQLIRYFIRRGRTFSASAVDYLTMIAEERETWVSSTDEAEDVLALSLRFETLQREIAVARQRALRSRLVGISAALIGLSFVFGAVVSAVSHTILNG